MGFDSQRFDPPTPLAAYGLTPVACDFELFFTGENTFMGVDYGWEKLYLAVRYGISSKESLQERLASCMVQIHHLDRNSFPDDRAWERFSKLLQETTKKPARFKGEGTIKATTDQMTDEEAGKHLDEICDLFSEVAEAYGRSNP